MYAAYEPMRGDDHKILAADLFHVEDVLVNSIYVFGLRSLARLLGDAPEAAEFNQQADRTLSAMLEKCWDEEAGAFFDLSGVAEKPLQTVTISSFMPAHPKRLAAGYRGADGGEVDLCTGPLLDAVPAAVGACFRPQVHPR